ncbi:unnamed protein product [Moneuplotes crassus]|uniref:Uncharacterized protein n=1 Tax=Euplotes crassus TaxID=5936 RepID=A0AAD1Y8S0_EUPCR|nr:unnamed protein product [Moneuplotes crassus]
MVKGICQARSWCRTGCGQGEKRIFRIMLICAVFIGLVSSTSNCRHDQFLENSGCFNCHESCKECAKYNKCTVCDDNYVFNETTGLCDWLECPDGQYYSHPSNGCQQCSSSCNSLCGYQSHCFECPPDKYLNLDDMTCVELCDEAFQVQVTDPQLHSIPLCRSLTYYVDPQSESTVELGTRQHPYKELDSALVEIVNFYSHSERIVTVLVQEGASVYVDSPTYIVNMTGVVFDTYSDWTDHPGFARMVGVMNSSKIIPPPLTTKFNILASKEKKTQNLIFENPGFKSDELIALGVGDAVFKPYHAGLTVKNFRVVTEYDDIATSHALVTPLRVDAKSVTFINVDFKCQGTILFAVSTGFNWHMENVAYETQNLYRLNYMIQKCGESGSYMGTKTYFKNVTAYNSGDKPPELHIEQASSRNFIVGDIYFEDVKLDTYTGYKVGIIQMLLFIDQRTCLPENPRLYNFTNFELTTSREAKNPEMDQTATFVITSLSGTQINPGEIHIQNFTCRNDRYYRHYCARIYSAGYKSYANNLYSYNSEGITFLFNGERIYLSNILSNNVSTISSQSFIVQARVELELQNMEMSNSISHNSGDSAMISIECLASCEMNLQNITLNNLQTSTFKGLLFFLGTSTSNLTVKDVYIKNIVMSGDSSGISYQSFHNITMENIIATNVTKKEGSDGMNPLISTSHSVTSSSHDTHQSISNLIFTQSSVSLLLITYPKYESTSTKSLIITNVSCQDSVFSSGTDLISFHNLASLGEYTIELTDLKFQNLSSNGISKLMHLQQQSAPALVIRDIHVSEVASMGATIEAYDTNNVYNYTLAEIHNMIAFNVDAGQRSLIEVNKQARVTLRNSTFFNISNVANGPVVHGVELASIAIYDSKFHNNTSNEGGVFATEAGSVIKCYRCLFTNNFAIDSGVIKVGRDGIFEFYDSQFYGNIAFMSSVSTIFSTQFQSLFNNCTFSENIILTKEEILTNIVPNIIKYQNLKDYITSNQYLFETKTPSSCIRVEFASLRLENQIKSIDQNMLLRADVGTIFIDGLIAENTTLVDYIIAVSESELYASNVLIRNLYYNMTRRNVVYVITSIATFKNITIIDSNINLIQSVVSVTNIEGLTATNIAGDHNMVVEFVRTRKEDISKTGEKITSSLKNIHISGITNNGDGIVRIVSSDLEEIHNVSVFNCNANIINARSTTISQISQLNTTNNIGGMKLFDSIVGNFKDSKFVNCGSQNVFEGGAIYLKNSNVSIVNSYFEHNQAIAGGAISIICSLHNPCAVILQNSTFSHNVAFSKGGAIYYNWNRPAMKGLKFQNNSALYGQDIASYPVKIVSKGTLVNKIPIKDVASGLRFTDSLDLELIDYDHQITNLENSNTVKLSPIEQNTNIKGNDFGKITNGSASISDIIFKSHAGNHLVTYSLTSKAIDRRKILSALNNSQGQYDNTVSANFRDCKPGEIQTKDDHCTECAFGTYTLNWNETQCHDCMDHAICQGKNIIHVDSGYWRKSLNSSKVMKCINADACDGGFEAQEEFPVKCSTGYKGYLCASCDILSDTKYEPVANFQCAKCPDKIVNTIRIILFFFLTMIFLGVIILLNLNKKKDNQMSILCRIFTNYLQLMSAALSYNVNVPGNFRGIFAQLDKISFQTLNFSYDCFIDDHEVRVFAPSISLFKQFLYLCLPVIIVLVMSACIVIIKVIFMKVRPNKNFELRRAIVVSLICIIFLLHPKLTFEALSAFRCTQVDSNDYRMTLHMDFKCFSIDHIMWCFLVGVPILIIYVIGCPLIAFVLLTRNKSDLQKWNFRKYFFILYQGLKPERYYWEFVNTLRKFTILAISLTLVSISVNAKLLLSVVCMIALVRLQNSLKPYKRAENNKIELLGILAGTVTIFCGIIFQRHKEGYSGFYTLATVVVFLLNFNFIIQFCYLLLLSLECKNEYYKCVLKVFTKILCKKYTDPEKSDNIQFSTDKTPIDGSLLKDDNSKPQKILRKNHKRRMFKLKKSKKFPRNRRTKRAPKSKNKSPKKELKSTKWMEEERKESTLNINPTSIYPTTNRLRPTTNENGNFS